MNKDIFNILQSINAGLATNQEIELISSKLERLSMLTDALLRDAKNTGKLFNLQNNINKEVSSTTKELRSEINSLRVYSTESRNIMRRMDDWFDRKIRYLSSKLNNKNNKT